MRFSDIAANETAIRRAHFLMDQQAIDNGTNIVHDPEPAIQKYFKRVKRFYGLNNKYDGRGNRR